MNTIEHRGRIRGGANSHARLFLHLIPITETIGKANPSELDALFAEWDSAAGLTSCNWVGRCYTINTRREFALIPVLIRRAAALGMDCAISQWDTGVKGKCLLSTDPAQFWQEIALAQMWVKE